MGDDTIRSRPVEAAILALLTLLGSGSLATSVVEVPASWAGDLSTTASGRGIAAAPGLPAGGSVVISVGSDLADIAIDGERQRAYVTDRSRAQVHVLDLDAAVILQSIPVRAEPVALAISPSGDLLYVGHAGHPSIIVIDLASLSPARALETGFLTWAIVAPTDTSLVATTHGDQGAEAGYVLDSRHGQVLGRLCYTQFCNPLSHDSLLALSPDRTRLYVAQSYLLQPVLVISYTRNLGQDTWSEVATNLGPGWGESGGEARDVVASGDAQFLYLATRQSTLLQLATSDLRVARRFGSFGTSSSVVTSATGNPIAMSASNATIHLFDVAGSAVAEIASSAPVEKLRVTPDGKSFVAIVGVEVQHIEVIATTSVVTHLRPLGTHVNSGRPLLSARVGTFLPLSEISAAMELDGSPVSTTFDRDSGVLRGTPPVSLQHGSHTVRVNAYFAGVQVASDARNFTVASSFVRGDKHFAIQIPVGWSALSNTTVGDLPIDVLLLAEEVDAGIYVTSMDWDVQGSHGEARTILDYALSRASQSIDFEVTEPVTDGTIDDHPAATVSIRIQSPPPGVDETLAVVLGAEWDMVWFLEGAMGSLEGTAVRAVIRETIASLDVLPVLAPPEAPPSPSLLIAIVSIAATAGLTSLVVVRDRRRRP